MARTTVLRRVWARAVVSAMVVASVPFLQKIAQSAWGATIAVIASASSTITPVGPVMVVAQAELAYIGRGIDLRVEA